MIAFLAGHNLGIGLVVKFFNTHFSTQLYQTERPNVRSDGMRAYREVIRIKHLLFEGRVHIVTTPPPAPTTLALESSMSDGITSQLSGDVPVLTLSLGYVAPLYTWFQPRGIAVALDTIVLVHAG